MKHRSALRVLLTTGLVGAGILGTAGSASAYACPVDVDPTTDISVASCYDVYEDDSDPTNPGTAVYGSASVTVEFYGFLHYCTGYSGGGVNADPTPTVIVDPDYAYDLPHEC